MDTADNLNRDADWILSQSLSSLGIDDHRKLDVTLRVARQAGANLAPEDCGNIWTTLFAYLVQSSPIGRPDLGELLNKVSFCARASLKVAALDQLVSQGRILTLNGGAGSRLPAFQIWNNKILGGVQEVNAATANQGLSDYARTMIILWPVGGGTSILDALRSGLTSEALAMANAFRGFLL